MRTQFGETYHSTNGAITESLHVYIKNGVETRIENTLSIFEMGFGTGLNAWLTCLYAINNNKKIYYTSIEKFPLTVENQLEFECPKIFENIINSQSYFHQILSAKNNIEQTINSHFTLLKIHDDFIFFEAINQFDIVYYDAFAPKYQPELWTENCLKGVFNSMRKKGIFVTYCANGEVKRILKNIGFAVNTIKGPPGKREMITAIKK